MANDTETISLSKEETETVLEAIDWMNHGHTDQASMMMPSVEGYLALEQQFNEMKMRCKFPAELNLTDHLLFDYSLLLNWAWREQLIDTDEQLEVLERLLSYVEKLLELRK